MKTSLHVLATGCAALLFCTARVAADLPEVVPPEEERPPSRVGITVEDSQSDNSASSGGVKVVPDREAPQEKPVDLDLLMKSMSDPKVPLGTELATQLSQVAAFGKLAPEQQNKAVPELLVLLGNDSGILPEGRPSPSVIQVRHRAAAALSRIAGVCLGQFPIRKADESLSREEREQDRKASEELVAAWKDWWQKARALDDAGRKELARTLRGALLDTASEDLFWTNVEFCREDRDPTPLEALGERLKAVDLKDRGAANRIIGAYGNICQAPGAPGEAGLLLIDLLRKNNTPENCADQMIFMTLRSATTYLRRIAGTGLTGYLEPKEIEYEEDGEKKTRTVHMITEEAIKTWEDAIKAKAEEKDAPAGDGPAEAKDEPDAAKAPAGRLQVIEVQNQNGVMNVQIRVAPRLNSDDQPAEAK